MPRLEHAIGGHMARRELQLSPDVSENCFAEILDPESQFARRRRVAMLPTRGHTQFDTFGHRITAMAGTRERAERLAVAAGRTIRIYRDPDDEKSLTTLSMEGAADATEQTIWPVLGAYAHTANGSEVYYACADRRIRRLSGATDPTVVLAPDYSPRGVAGSPAQGTNGRLWVSAVEDFTIRCYDRQADGALAAAPQYDLDVVASGCQQPESLYWLNADGIMAVCDAAGGDVYLFRLAGDEWAQVNRSGISNTLALQFAVGSTDTRRPARPGGVHLNATELRVIDLGGQQEVVFSRGTGGVKSRTPLPAGITGAGVPGGYVGNQDAAPRLFVPGDQPSGGRAFTVAGGAEWKAGLTTPAAAFIDEPAGQLVPLDDSSRYLAWAVERKIHIADLRENRIIPSVAAGIDRITAAAGRFVGADAAEGRLKVSPAAARIQTEDARRKVIEPPASIRIPGWPRANSRPVRAAYFGSRYALVVNDRFALHRYDRGDMDADPVQVLPDNVTYVAASGGARTAGQLVLVLRGTQNGRVDVRWFDRIPTNAAETAAARATQSFTDLNLSTDGSLAWNSIRSLACDDDYIYILFSVSAGLRSAVFRRSDAQPVAALGTLHNPNTWGPPSNEGYTEIWGIDLADGILRGALRSTVGTNPTILRALSRNAETGYSARPEHYIDGSFVTTRNTALTHDSKFLYDIAGTDRADYTMPDGTPTLANVAVAFWLADPDVRSSYRWPSGLWQTDSTVAVTSIRGQLYSWSRTQFRIYQSEPGATGFPFSLSATRDVGCSAPASIALIEERLFWVGASSSGGVRVWEVGADSDTAPEPLLTQAIEEALDSIGRSVFDGIAWGDDNGGHPTYVIGFRDPGVTFCYDAHSKEWHTRTSLRLAGDTNDPFPWQDADRGHYRVEASTQWHDRQFLGGYGADGGIIAEPSVTDWRDIDGGPVRRVRAFAGVSLEKRLIRYATMRVDVAYDVGQADSATPGIVAPKFALQKSNDGGRTWGDPQFRAIGGRVPPAFHRLGSSKFRAYRVTCDDAVGFMITGVYLVEPGVSEHL